MRKLVVGLVALVIVGVGCIHETDYTGNPEGLHVVVIGDSITSDSATQLHGALDGDHTVKLSGIVGATIDEQQLHAEEYAAADPSPEVVVITLGTNDAWKDVPTATSAANLDAMIAGFPSSCVVLTTINEHVGPPTVTPTKNGRLYSNELAAALNVELRPKADVVIEWDAAVNTDPARFLKADTVHPTPDGSTLYGQLIAEAIESCPAAA